MIESLASEISKLKVEQHSGKGRVPNTFAPNLNPYRRPNEQLQILQRSKEANEDQRVKDPFQNAVIEEEQFEEGDEIHCMEDKGICTFLTKAAYEVSRTTEQCLSYKKKIKSSSYYCIGHGVYLAWNKSLKTTYLQYQGLKAFIEIKFEEQPIEWAIKNISSFL